jgi:circadian clock protein KaiC
MVSRGNGKATENIAKPPTGIEGFDEIASAADRRRRGALLVGAPGSAKMVLALQPPVNGARPKGEVGIFVAFEECSQQVVANAASSPKWRWSMASIGHTSLCGW